MKRQVGGVGNHVLEEPLLDHVRELLADDIERHLALAEAGHHGAALDVARDVGHAVFNRVDRDFDLEGVLPGTGGLYRNVQARRNLRGSGTGGKLFARGGIRTPMSLPTGS